MKTLLTLAFCLAVAGSALAQGAGYGGILGIYFSEDQFDQSTMEIQTPMNVPVRAYVVLTDAQYDGVRGYECSVTPMHELAIVLAADGPNGWTNYGTVTDFMVGYTGPLPVTDGAAVLGWIDYLLLTDEQVDVMMGPSSLHSIPGWEGPAIVFDHDITQIYHLDLSSGAHGYPDVVAVINPAPVAVEAHTLSHVKSLFE